MDTQQYEDFLRFIFEKDNMGLLEVLVTRPRPKTRYGGRPYVIFRVLAGYYRKLILPEVQRAQPELVRINRDRDQEGDMEIAPLSAHTEVRVKVYF